MGTKSNSSGNRSNLSSILIIATARWQGGLSGSDNIYFNLSRYWGNCEVWEMLDLDYRPFIICYIHRIFISCLLAIFESRKFEFVYSASDFYMDLFPAFILKLKGNKWVASYYLHAPKTNKIYWLSQHLARFIIRHFADKVCVTNKSITLKHRHEIEVHGGVNLEHAGEGNSERHFDAVYCGRFHSTKGIKELMQIWDIVLSKKPDARLAVIGGGDDCENEFVDWMDKHPSVKYYGYMGVERFQIYKMSKLVLYPATYNHFSMSPVEAMACGCPMIAFNLPIMKYMEETQGLKGCALIDTMSTEVFAFAILDYLKGRHKQKQKEAIEWARTWDWKTRATDILKQIRG